MLDGLDVRAGIDLAVDVDDVLVAEEAHDLGDRVGLADVGEELVAEALALARALHEARDVDELDGRGHDPLRVDDLGEPVEPSVGHRHDADVGLDGGERVVGGVRPGSCVSAVNSVDLPTLGRPTIPMESAMTMLLSAGRKRH